MPGPGRISKGLPALPNGTRVGTATLIAYARELVWSPFPPAPFEEAMQPLLGDLPPEHLLWLATGAMCITCGETYPGSREHSISWNAEAQMFQPRDAAHQGNWHTDEQLTDEQIAARLMEA